MIIYSIFVRDPEMGDELVICYTRRGAAEKFATKLRKTFRYVQVQPVELSLGHHAPTQLRALAGARR